MKLEWNDPNFKDLSVVNTEAANKTNPIHDGTIYHTNYGDFEGHKS